jgi:putative colanic acid biosynthesis UDP-glucose lipid carrier transferase
VSLYAARGFVSRTVVFKHSVAIALLTLAQAVLPPMLAGGCLYALVKIFSLHGREQDYLFLTALVVVLGAVLLQPKRSLTPQLIHGRLRLAGLIAFRWLLLLFVLLAIGYATKSSTIFSRRVLLTWAVATPGILIFANLVMHEALRRVLSDPANARRSVFVGYNEISLALARRLMSNTSAGLAVSGFFDDRAPARLGSTPGIQLCGGLKDIVRHVKTNAIDVIFVALPVSHLERVKQLLEELRDTTVSIYYIPTVFAFDSIQGGTSELLGVPLIALCETPFHGYRGVSKRLTDIIVATVTLIVASPLMLLAAILVKMSSRGSIIFKQRRYGLDGREIIIYKFRTMTVTEDTGPIRQATRGDARVTAVGRLLRRTSLDELPQLVNVLQGRMSLVGPRPHAVAHNELYRKLIKGYMVRHKVPPGITGLAQVHGLRGETTSVELMEARVQYDLEYLRNWSVLLDFQILLKTLSIVARGRNAY